MVRIHDMKSLWITFEAPHPLAKGAVHVNIDGNYYDHEEEEDNYHDHDHDWDEQKEKRMILVTRKF